MKRTFRPEEINAMQRAAAALQQGGSVVEGRSITPCTFRQSGQLATEQVAALNPVHEGFARCLTQSLGAYLRVEFETKLASIEQLSYREFLERIPEVTYTVAIQVEPASAKAALQIDHSLIFPLVDILLGGTGACEILSREISEIEERIMEEVASIICHELEVAWVALGAKFNLAKRQSHAQMLRLLPPTEKTLSLSFEIKLADARGMLNVVVPRAASNALLRKLSTDWSQDQAPSTDRASRPLAAKLIDCPFEIDLGVSGITLPIETVMRLAPQNICNLGISARRPASLILAGRETFEAAPVRQVRRRAAQVLRPCSVVNEEREP
jgi:flagellar motor switch protein FliM